MRIVCDTNVLISAVLYGGPPRRVLQHIIEGKHEGFISPPIENEFQAVLARPKFGLSARQAHEIARQVHELFQMVFPAQSIQAIPDNPADDAVLECAVAAGADYIISGDGHLLALAKFREMDILSPADFLTR